MDILKNKKGQGLSLNVIIVAALALIVLVVLAAIFVGRIGMFDRGISEEGQSDLLKARVGYGTCHPSDGVENTFLSTMETAVNDQAAQSAAYDNLIQKVRECKAEGADQTTCESVSGCFWG
jgi:hypothetical protein